MNKFKKVAIRSARSSGKYLLKNYNQLKKKDIHLKKKHDLVTKYDMEANNIIIKTIKENFPNHDLLSEETGFEDKSDIYQWIIDPLDGTTNFVMHTPLYCISISLVYKKDILLSVVYAPSLGEFYFAAKGQGAFLNGKRLKVSTKDRLAESIILIGRSHSRESRINFIKIQEVLENNVLNVKRLGSASLDMAYTAAGRVSGYVMVPPEVMLWDSIAGVLLIREAGGRVTDFKGQDWHFDSQGVVSSNSLIHEQLIQLISKWK